jgi:FAD/FMN-containing dehydrogenase
VVRLLHHLRGSGLALEAFEVMWQDFYAMSCGWLKSAPPLETTFPLYVLCDLEGDADRVQRVLELALANREISDAVLAGSKAQARQLWKIREATAEFPSRLAAINFDVSLPIATIGECAAAIRDALSQRWPGCRSVFFGHIGDSNLHLTVDGKSLPKNDAAAHHAVESLVYDLVGKRGGSISAEHGIGLLKREFLHHSVTEAGLETMRTIKHALDPHGILNPGKVLAIEPARSGDR